MTELSPQLSRYHSQIEATLTPIITIQTQKAKQTLPIEASKIGGFAYWPEAQALPTVDNEDAKLVAQINFSELYAQGLTLPDFPREGLLQFFYPVGDDMAGLKFETEADFSAIKVVYHPNTQAIPSQDATLFSSMNNHEGMPCEGELSLLFSASQEYLGLNDEYQTKRQYDFTQELSDEENDTFFDNVSNSGSKLGGYAYFTQQDPRPYLTVNGVNTPAPEDTPENEWVLLLQLDSDDHFMWGDAGVANWFIRRADLKALDFSRVLFNWDCC